MKVVRRLAFADDLIEHYATIAAEQPAAAERFADAVDRLVRDLAVFPESGRVWEPGDPRLGEVRFRLVAGFRILLFYRIDANRILLLRAVHGARGDIQTLLGDQIADT